MGVPQKTLCLKHSSNFRNKAKSSINQCMQVAVIVAGCTHAVYHKTLQLALGIPAVTGPSETVQYGHGRTTFRHKKYNYLILNNTGHILTENG